MVAPLLLGLLLSLSTAVDGDLALLGVTLIDGTGGAPAPGRTVLVRDGRIADIRPAGELALDGVRTLDGRGLFCIPGLWDMHTHALSATGIEHALAAFVRHGVTGIRDMSGPLPLEDLAVLREELDDGRTLGPRFVTPGPLLDGPGRPVTALGPAVRAVATEAEARAAVRELHGRGADFVKVYNRLTPELLAAICDEASRLGLPVAGHVPHVLSAQEMLAHGPRSLEHMQGLLEACSSRGDELLEATRRLLSGSSERAAVEEVLALRRAVVDTIDPARTRTLVATLRERGVWLCPTLVSNRTLGFVAVDASLRDDPRIAELPRAWTDAWQPPRTPEGPEHHRDRLRRIGELLLAAHRAGVPILAGTDFGVPYVYPGASLHDELELLVAAGLTPLEALRSATLEPARYLGREAELGTVEVGKRADLVLLADDPLADIRNTRRVVGVVLRGRWIPVEPAEAR